MLHEARSQADPKLDLRLESASPCFPVEVQTAYLELQVAFDDCFQQACGAASWFMLRRHKCICNPTHDATFQDTTPPSCSGQPFQKCQCNSGMHVLCVYHALRQVVVQLRRGAAGRQSPTCSRPVRAR